MLHLILFFVFAAICIGGAINLLAQRHPINSALSLIVVMGSLAVEYLLLGAEFVAVIQVIVYAGAIMVVFLFVIMLLNLGHPSELADARGSGWRIVAGAVGIALLAEVFALTRARMPDRLSLSPGSLAQDIAREGAIAPIARPLFTQYLLAFELTSILLLAAIVGAVVLGRRRQDAR